MVLYESHSVIHGRPFPLKGGFYANVFIHFEPLGALDDEIRYDEKIPPYLIPNSKWEETWWRHNPDGWNPMDERLKIFRAAATSGDADALEAAVKSYPEGLDEEDQNGWLPLHEAVRAGQLGTVKVILKHGGDINNETFARQTPLNIARKFLGDDHEVTKFLEKNGAVDLSPEYL